MSTFVYYGILIYKIYPYITVFYYTYNSCYYTYIITNKCIKNIKKLLESKKIKNTEIDFEYDMCEI